VPARVRVTSPAFTHTSLQPAKKMKNPNLKNLVQELKKTSIKQDVKIWKRIATELERPLRRRRVVNLSRIDQYGKNNETVIVPGKVLGMGEITKKITVAAFRFSGQAKEKILSSGSKAITINELLKKNPKGTKVKIVG